MFYSTKCLVSKGNSPNLKSSFFQPCMKKTDKVSGLVTRNCAPFEQNTDRCILDKRGNEVCYCFENLCNVSAPSSVIVNHYTAIMVLSLATSYYYR